MAEAFAKLPPETIVDGELRLVDPRGAAHFYRLMREMRTNHPDELQLVFLAFDLLFERGIDLRGLPLTDRKRDLHRLCSKSKVPFLREVQTSAAPKRLGLSLLEQAEPQLGQVKVSRLEKNQCRGHKRFEGPRKPELTEAQKTVAKKRQELARVIERLRSPRLSHGIARELRKQQATMEREIAELEN